MGTKRGVVDKSYRVNRPIVVDEILGDEVIIVNLDNGYYFSLGGSGVEFWRALDQGFPLPAIVKQLQSEFEASAEKLRAACSALLEQLEQEAIILPLDEQAQAAEPGVGNVTESGERKAFEPPALQKYTDLQNLLLLDPIHEVDELGWPHAAPED